MARKPSSKYPGDFKTVFGLSTMMLTSVGASSFMTSMFMMYLTDYSGIGAYAATLGTVLLMIGRIVDAVNDPLQGWIMDRTKPTKLGKYKPYVILSILITTISVALLYSLPDAITSKPVLVTLWVLFFYLAYDFGTSFFADAPLKASLTDDPVVRAKISVWPRAVGMFGAIPFAFFTAILVAVNAGIGNMKTSFSVATLLLVIPYALISLLGIALVKEGKHKDVVEAEAKLSIKDIIAMFKTNKPLLVNSATKVFGGFVWTLLFAANGYYIKWAYCVDANGVLDEGLLGTLTAVMGMLQIFPILIGAFVAPAVMRKAGDPIKVKRFLLVIQMVCGIAMFVLHIVGIMPQSPVLFSALVCIMLFAIGIEFVPSAVVDMETFDYGFWKSGKEVAGICNSVSKFIEKLQAAGSTAMVGAVLIMIGYQVDSVTGNFVGELSAIPGMLTGFMVISGLLPGILCLISWVILKKYPITNAVRAEMSAALAEMKKTEV